MAAERTWLAWWRTALGATAGALAVGRFAPQLLDVAPLPYILLGCGYASLAVGLSIVGAQRQRELEHALRTGGHAPLRFRTVALFTVGGVAVTQLMLGAEGPAAVKLLPLEGTKFTVNELGEKE